MIGGCGGRGGWECGGGGDGVDILWVWLREGDSPCRCCYVL